VDITSRLVGTVAGGGRVELTLVGVASHTLSGRRVLFTAKQLVARDAGILGPVAVTLNPAHPSTGTLSSPTFPATHKQNFFLRIQSEKLGTLVSDAPVVMSAKIQGTPPTATYKSTGGDVAFYREGDSNKRPVFTVHEVTSDVKPAVATVVDMTSRVTARVGGAVANLTLAGSAAHLLSGTSVIFIAKQLVAVNPGDAIGPLTATLDPQHPSLGTLSSDTFPAEHRQSFFLRLQSPRLGTLVSDAPIVMTARIDASPPTATYKMAGEPVAFHKQGDPRGRTVLTIEGVESDVKPAAPVRVEISSRLTGTLASGGTIAITLAGPASHTQVGQLVFFNAKRLATRDAGPLGPLTASLDPKRESLGTLSSATLPATHRQSFFLRLESEKLGTLVSDAPLTLSARIQSSPPTATYRTAGGKVDFYIEGDPDHRPVLTVRQVVSKVKPAAGQ
jgi:hypothetical protein